MHVSYESYMNGSLGVLLTFDLAPVLTDFVSFLAKIVNVLR